MHSVGISLFKFSGAAGSNNWLIDKMVKLQLSKKKKILNLWIIMAYLVCMFK